MHLSKIFAACIATTLALLALSLTAMATPPAEDTEAHELRFLGITTAAPAGWTQQAPTSSMRLAQFTITSTDGAQNAEVIFYYFGATQGGSPEANIARWQAQFHGPDGLAVEPEVHRLQSNGMEITRVELHGSYARGIGTGPGGAGRPQQTLIAAIVQTPRGQVTIQLHGDDTLVAAEEPAFDAMLAALRPLDTP